MVNIWSKKWCIKCDKTTPHLEIVSEINNNYGSKIWKCNICGEIKSISGYPETIKS